jgi:hypothetical protein
MIKSVIPMPIGCDEEMFFFGVFFCWAFMLYNESSRHVRKFGLVLCSVPWRLGGRLFLVKFLPKRKRERKDPFF